MKQVFELMDGELLIKSLTYFAFHKDDSPENMKVYDAAKSVYEKRFGVKYNR
jgi:hypothetical protein